MLGMMSALSLFDGHSGKSEKRKRTAMENGKMKFVYVITGKGERKFLNKVGVAFVNRDGSLNCKLDSLPVTGELHIRDVQLREQRESQERRPLAQLDGPHALAS